jgi:hypothetical protein
MRSLISPAKQEDELMGRDTNLPPAVHIRMLCLCNTLFFTAMGWEGKTVVYLIHHVRQMQMIQIEPDFDEAPTVIVCESCRHSMRYMMTLSGVEFGECHKCGGTMIAMSREEQSDKTTQSKLTDY